MLEHSAPLEKALCGVENGPPPKEERPFEVQVGVVLRGLKEVAEKSRGAVRDVLANVAVAEALADGAQPQRVVQACRERGLGEERVVVQREEEPLAGGDLRP